MREAYIVIKYNHGEIEYLKGISNTLHGEKFNWTTDMSQAELFELVEVFELCSRVSGFAVKQILF